MAKRKPTLPDYGTVQIKGNTYFRTRVSDDEGNRFSLYAATREELYEKVLEVEKQIENKTFRRNTPTVRECLQTVERYYCAVTNGDGTR